jgi:vitamin B12 transporter
MTTAVLLVLLGAFSRLLPHPPNFVVLGALALFSGARLPRRSAFFVPLLAMALSDAVLDFGTGRAALSPGRLTIYAAFAAIVLVGRFARGPARTWRLAALSICASSLFFLASNFGVWAFGSLYPKTSAGLALCFAAAVPFFWNTLAADLLGTAALFGLEALSLSRRTRRRAVARLGAVLVLASGVAAAALAQQAAPVKETVVVSATAAAEEEPVVGAATTVITRERIERGGFHTVAEVLRSVPGVDIIRSGSDGSVTFAEIRGANSTQTLVLVDGQRLNSPYFPGYDLSSLTTENIERIEIVRGPFSALYGSDALGGVIQIFTRLAGPGLAGQATAEAGDAGQRAGSLFASWGGESLAISGSYRDGRVGGDRVNSDWKQQNGAMRIEGRAASGARIALEGAIEDSDLGVPGPVGRESPHARYGTRQERLSLPISFSPAPGHEATLLFADVISRPRFDDPDSFFSAQTDARSLQGRASDTWTSGANRLTGFVSFERGRVNDGSNFGPSLEGQHTTIWGAGVEDTWRLAGGITATAGVRYDDHSQFGTAWSPRATLSWLSADARWKVRASGGSAFRAPTVGELYYLFSGNPDLKPERSTSYELGVERYLTGGRIEASLFWNDFRDLIVFDFVSSLNLNVGRARTRGVEVALRQDLARTLSVDAGYRYLDAFDRGTGLTLIRRPRHRAYLGASWQPLGRLSLAPRVTLVGSRPDSDALTGQRVESPSFLRLDLFARYALGSVAPYARVENLADRRYEEVNGYPAPRRRFAAGIEARF